MKFFSFILAIVLVVVGIVYFTSEKEETQRGFYVKAGEIYCDSIYKFA